MTVNEAMTQLALAVHEHLRTQGRIVSFGVHWSATVRDKDGNYVRLGDPPLIGGRRPGRAKRPRPR